MKFHLSKRLMGSIFIVVCVLILGVIAWQTYKPSTSSSTTPPHPPLPTFQFSELPPAVQTCLTEKLGSDASEQLSLANEKSEISATINTCFEDMLNHMYPNGPPTSEATQPKQ